MIKKIIPTLLLLLTNCIIGRSFHTFAFFIKSYEDPASGLHIFGRKLLVSHKNTLKVYDIINPENPEFITSHSFDEEIFDTFALSNLIFVASKKLYILNENLNEISSIDIKARKIEVDGNLLYLLSENQLFLFGITNITNPEVITAIRGIRDFSANGDIICIATDNGVKFLRLKQEKITILSGIEKNAFKVFLGRFFLALIGFESGEYSIRFYDVSSIHQIQEMSEVHLYYPLHSTDFLVIRDNIAFVITISKDSGELQRGKGELQMFEIEIDVEVSEKTPHVFYVNEFVKGKERYYEEVKDLDALFPYIYVATGEKVDIFKLDVREISM